MALLETSPYKSRPKIVVVYEGGLDRVMVRLDKRCCDLKNLHWCNGGDWARSRRERGERCGTALFLVS